MMRIGFILFGLLAIAVPDIRAEGPVSDATDECLSCHYSVFPGIIADWKAGRHSRITPREAIRKDELARRFSAAQVPDELAKTVVGCAECHTLNPSRHPDSFEHNGYQVHVVVTPQDCAVCHPVEREQYGKNLMAYAHHNLTNNPLYDHLADTINGVQTFENMRTARKPPDALTEQDSCLFCHGTKVEMTELRTRETDWGEMQFPALTGWPNQGVGRINPDGSMGACTSCHTRHAFAIEMARKPDTCSECHHGPDVPAYPVYKVSKHGNIYASLKKRWDFEAVPWQVGTDFTAPTCAVCHMSLITTEEDMVVVERTHQVSNRLPWRIFGLIYAHPHPKSPDTTVIKNSADLPLPTELTGEPVATFLIDEEEQSERLETMQKACYTCHSYDWVQGHFHRFERTIQTANDMTLAATRIMLTAWEKHAARGLALGDSIFNEAIEKKWMSQWLFYGNSTRFASAMAGADYGVFANGRWKMAENVQQLLDWLQFKTKVNPPPDFGP